MTEDFGCTDCHKFHDKGKLGDAPELTGYGSPEWIAGIIGNPADEAVLWQAQRPHARLRPSATDPAQNTLSSHQIEMLTDWLRGEWYEEGSEMRMRDEGCKVRSTEYGVRSAKHFLSRLTTPYSYSVLPYYPLSTIHYPLSTIPCFSPTPPTG